MKDYVNRRALRDALYDADAISIRGSEIINTFPAADVVSQKLFDQIDWERTVAISQLAEIGKGLGEKMDDVVERKTGKWEYDPDGMDWGIGAWVCSECGGRNDNIPAFVRGVDGHEQKVNPYRWAGSKFCPNCGARMVSE